MKNNKQYVFFQVTSKKTPIPSEVPESDTFFVLISRVATLIPYTKKVLIPIRVVWYVSFWYWYDTFPKTILWYLCSFFWYLLQKTELATVALFFCCYFLCWYDTLHFFLWSSKRVISCHLLVARNGVIFFCWHEHDNDLLRKDLFFCWRKNNFGTNLDSFWLLSSLMQIVGKKF